MRGETLRGPGDEEPGAELDTVTQDMLGLLLEDIRSRCLTGFLATMGSGGVSFRGVQRDGKSMEIDLYYYGNSEGPTRHDADGSISTDKTGRYKHSHDSFYYDTGVQATLFKTEKADESQANGKKLFTAYTIINDGRQLEIDKRVRPLELPIFLRYGDQLIPKKDNPPLITAHEQQASRQQEDELGLSLVSDNEAKDLIELLRTL